MPYQFVGKSHIPTFGHEMALTFTISPIRPFGYKTWHLVVLQVDRHYAILNDLINICLECVKVEPSVEQLWSRPLDRWVSNPIPADLL